MDLKSYATDEQLEEEGRWIPLEDGEFLIAASGNPQHKKLIAKLARTKYAQALRQQNVREIEKMNVEAMAGAILLDWRGNVNVDGKPVTYSKEAALALLKFSQFREWVATQSTTVANFQAEEEAADRADLKSGDGMGSGVGRAS